MPNPDGSPTEEEFKKIHQGRSREEDAKFWQDHANDLDENDLLVQIDKKLGVIIELLRAASSAPAWTSMGPPTHRAQAESLGPKEA